MLLSDLLNQIVGVSEQSAKLARAIRSEHALFELLVEEKTGDSKNKRFVQDFKTLADVLVQEMVRNHLGKKFPGLAEHIYGEESNKFTNVLGEAVEVSVQATQEETCKLLERVLDGNTQAAELLAGVVHKELPPSSDLPTIPEQEIDESSLGVWIDPIDSTAQYIHGNESRPSSVCVDVCEEGLQCVTILIGVYERATGVPVMGVVNQPFSSQDGDASWSGRVIWGIAYNDIHLHSPPPLSSASPPPKASIVLSSSESPDVQAVLEADFSLVDAAGAGYKILCVADHSVDLYLLTRASTFKWDTCAPQAVLLAQKGGVWDYLKAKEVVKSHPEAKEEVLEEQLKKECGVVYDKPDREGVESGEKWSNAGGIVAYRDIKLAVKMLKKLRDV